MPPFHIHADKNIINIVIDDSMIVPLLTPRTTPKFSPFTPSTPSVVVLVVDDDDDDESYSPNSPDSEVKNSQLTFGKHFSSSSSPLQSSLVLHCLLALQVSIALAYVVPQKYPRIFIVATLTGEPVGVSVSVVGDADGRGLVGDNVGDLVCPLMVGEPLVDGTVVGILVGLVDGNMVVDGDKLGDALGELDGETHRISVKHMYPTLDPKPSIVSSKSTYFRPLQSLPLPPYVPCSTAATPHFV